MKGVLLIPILLVGAFSCAQPSVKLFGYSQKFVPGMVPQEDLPDENGGQPVKRPRVITNYYIYTATATSVTIVPTAIWIGGKWDTITSQQVIKSPVFTEVPEKKQLVPLTSRVVKQLNIGDTLQSPLAGIGKLKKMMSENEVIISYTWKGKRYFIPLKKLSALEPVHGL